jgi:hypothetical protein
MDTDTFVAADLCCACGGGETVYSGDDSDDYYAAEGEECGYSDNLGYDVECDTGLTCEEQTSDDGTVTMTCVVYEAPTDYDGIGQDSDGTLLGYWYLNEDQTENSGHYVTSDGRYTGVWNYDEDSTLSGTWTQDDGYAEGTWYAE